MAYAGRALTLTQLGQYPMAWIDTEMAVVLGIDRVVLEAEIEAIKRRRQDSGLT